MVGSLPCLFLWFSRGLTSLISFSDTLHFVLAPRVDLFARQLQLCLAQHPRLVFVFVGPSFVVFGFFVCPPFFFVCSPLFFVGLGLALVFFGFFVCTPFFVVCTPFFFFVGLGLALVVFGGRVCSPLFFFVVGRALELGQLCIAG
jgi:hypothetical protein